MALEPFQVAAPIDDFIDPRLEKKNRQECGSKDLHSMDRTRDGVEVVHKSLSGARALPRQLRRRVSMGMLLSALFLRDERRRGRRVKHLQVFGVVISHRRERYVHVFESLWIFLDP